MVAYTSAVAVLDPAGDIPEDGRNKIHHVKDGSGKTVKFQNPYPSAARETSPWSIAPKILW
jgi:N-acyl-phosphatidylethanolamine-hydrolysing phospholipase D